MPSLFPAVWLVRKEQDGHIRTKHSIFKLNKIRKTPICNLIYNSPKQKDETYLNNHYSKKTNERIYLRKGCNE